jgi:hypothetical protein
MSQFILPTVPPYKNYSFEVVLDEETYRIKLYFNARDDAYYVSVYDAAETAIVEGRKLTNDSFPLYGVSGETRPAGTLYVADTVSANRPPVIGELGDTFELLYLDEAELDAL